MPLNAVLYEPRGTTRGRDQVSRSWRFIPFVLSSLACDGFPTRESMELLEKKENINVLAAHCAGWSGQQPLEVEVRVDVEDFGPSTGPTLETVWDFGDGSTDGDTRPRPGITNGMPAKYRFGVSSTHVYKAPGSYVAIATVKNGARTTTCSMSLRVLPAGQTMKHPQG